MMARAHIVLTGRLLGGNLQAATEKAIAVGIHVAPGLVAISGPQHGTGTDLVARVPGAIGTISTPTVARVRIAMAIGIFGPAVTCMTGAIAMMEITIVGGMTRRVHGKSRCAYRPKTAASGGTGVSAGIGLTMTIVGRTSWRQSATRTILLRYVTMALSKHQEIVILVHQTKIHNMTTKDCSCVGRSESQKA